ncbi:hypothetical protein [Candidatus Methylocalor cossyra]
MDQPAPKHDLGHCLVGKRPFFGLGVKRRTQFYWAAIVHHSAFPRRSGFR